MPNENPSERLEWSEENLSQVVAAIYQAAQTDQSLHARLLANPFEVLNSRIVVPDDYRAGIFARERGQETMMLWVSPFGVTKETLPDGTAAEGEKPEYERLCTMLPPW